jgi:hypothetical protein
VQAGALEDVVKASQLEIIELQHTVNELRYLTLESNAKLFVICLTLEFDM